LLPLLVALLIPKGLIDSAVVVFLFLAGLWFAGAIINGPNFHPNFTLAATTIRVTMKNEVVIFTAHTPHICSYICKSVSEEI